MTGTTRGGEARAMDHSGTGSSCEPNLSTGVWNASTFAVHKVACPTPTTFG